MSMTRPQVIPADKKFRIVMSIIAGEVTVAVAARRRKVSEQSIGRWKAEFLEAAKPSLTRTRIRILRERNPAVRSGGSPRGIMNPC